MYQIAEGNGNPLKYSCLANPTDGGAWWAAVHGVAKSRTPEQLHFHFSLSCIGEGNATHSSVLAWRIPGTGEPGGLPSMGSHRVGHDWSDLAAACSKIAIRILSLGPETLAVRSEALRSKFTRVSTERIDTGYV